MLLIMLSIFVIVGTALAVPSVQLNKTLNYSVTSEYPIIDLVRNISRQNVNSSEFWDNLDTPADIDHNDLNNLLWSLSGHTIDTDLDLGENELLGTWNGSIDYMPLSGGTFTGDVDLGTHNLIHVGNINGAIIGSDINNAWFGDVRIFSPANNRINFSNGTTNLGFRGDVDVANTGSINVDGTLDIDWAGFKSISCGIGCMSIRDASYGSGLGNAGSFAIEYTNQDTRTYDTPTFSGAILGTSGLRITDGGLNISGNNGDSLFWVRKQDPRILWMFAHANSEFGSLVMFGKGRGTDTSPTLSLDGDILGRIGARGFMGSDDYVPANYGDSASIYMTATENHVDGSTPGQLEFWTTPNASSTLVERGSFNENGLFKLETNTTGVTCDATTEGSIYYDTNLNKHRGCNTTAWFDLY